MSIIIYRILITITGVFNPIFLKPFLKPFFKVLLYIDKKSTTISSSKIFEKGGNKYTYTLSNMNTATIVPDTKFLLDAKMFPGAEIVDLR